MNENDNSQLVSENPTINDKVEHICWYLNQHENSEVSVDRVADEVGLDWAETHRLLSVIETASNLSPDTTHLGDGVLVGSRPIPVEKELYDDEMASTLSHIFFYNRLNGKITDSLPITNHSVLRNNRDLLKEAEHKELIELSGSDVCLTATGVELVEKTRSRIKERCDDY